MRRPSSPPSGRSTLMTSAPRSANTAPANGPARTWPNSITRIPVSTGMSFHLDAGIGDDALPFGDLGLDEAAELLRRARDQVHAVGRQALAHQRPAHDLDQMLVQGRDDRRRR